MARLSWVDESGGGRKARKKKYKKSLAPKEGSKDVRTGWFERKATGKTPRKRKTRNIKGKNHPMKMEDGSRQVRLEKKGARKYRGQCQRKFRGEKNKSCECWVKKRKKKEMNERS